MGSGSVGGAFFAEIGQRGGGVLDGVALFFVGIRYIEIGQVSRELFLLVGEVLQLFFCFSRLVGVDGFLNLFREVRLLFA